MPGKPVKHDPKSTGAQQSPKKSDQGAPIETYRGEVTDGERIDGRGDLDKETLDPDAPFNKSYGRPDQDDPASA